jgi:hypothetical protein
MKLSIVKSKNMGFLEKHKLGDDVLGVCIYSLLSVYIMNERFKGTFDIEDKVKINFKSFYESENRGGSEGKTCVFE